MSLGQLTKVIVITFALGLDPSGVRQRPSVSPGFRPIIRRTDPLVKRRYADAFYFKTQETINEIQHDRSDKGQAS